MAQNSTRQNNGEQGGQFSTSGIPPLMSPFPPWPAYPQYHRGAPPPTQEFWRDDSQYQSSWSVNQQWSNPPFPGYPPNSYDRGLRGPHQPRGNTSRGSKSQFNWKRPRVSEEAPKQPKKQKGVAPHQRHGKRCNGADVRKTKQHAPPDSLSAEKKKNGKTPSKAAKEDERKATVAKVTAHVKNSARKDLNMKLLENKAASSTHLELNYNRSSAKEAVADIHLTPEDFRTIGSCTRQQPKPTSMSAVVLQDIGFIDPSPDLQSSVDFSSLQVVDEWASDTADTEDVSGLNTKSPEPSVGAVESVVEQHEKQEQLPTDVLKMKQQVLQKILTMDKLKRTQLIEDPKSSSSRFVIDHLVKEHQTAVSRRLTQLRFHVDVGAHTLYNEIDGTLSETCDDLDISQLPEALLEQVQEIITSENKQPAVPPDQEEDIQILEIPTKPSPPCIDLEEPVEDVSPSSSDNKNSQEVTTESVDVKQNDVPSSPVVAVPAPEEIPPGLVAPVPAETMEETMEHTDGGAVSEIPNPVDHPGVDDSVAANEVSFAMEEPESTEGNNGVALPSCLAGTTEELQSSTQVAKVSAGELAPVSYTYHLKILKDLFKQEQSQYAALKSLDKTVKEILAKRQNVMKSLARVKKRQFEILNELQANRQPSALVEERQTVETSLAEIVGGAPAEEIPTSSTEAQVQHAMIETTSENIPSLQAVITTQEPATQGTSVSAPQPRLLEIVNQLTAGGFRVSVEERQGEPTPADSSPQLPATARRRTTSSRGENPVSSLRTNGGSGSTQERSCRDQASPKTAAEIKEEIVTQSQLEDAACLEQGTERRGQQEEQLAYKPLLSHKGAVECLHAIGPLLFTGSADKMVHVYDVGSRCLMQRIDVHKGPVKFVYALPLRIPTHMLPLSASSAEYLGHLDVITGCSDGFVRRIDMSTSQVVHEIVTRYPVTCMARTHPQSRVFLLGAVQGYIYQYNPKHAHLQLAEYKAESDVICMVVTQLLARKVVIISAKNCPVVVRDCRSGILLLTLHLGPNLRRICAVSTLGDYIYCADAARNVIVCDSANSGAVVREIKLPTCAMKICESEKLMYLGCYDGVVRVLDTTTLAVVKDIAVYNRKDLTCMQIEDKKIYLANRAGEVGYLEGTQQ